MLMTIFEVVLTLALLAAPMGFRPRLALVEMRASL